MPLLCAVPSRLARCHRSLPYARCSLRSSSRTATSFTPHPRIPAHVGNAHPGENPCCCVTNHTSHVFLLMKDEAIMEIKVTHLDHFKFAIHSRSHSIICDQPADNGGEDSGMTPPELLLA